MTVLTFICAVVALATVTAARIARINRIEGDTEPDRVGRWASEVDALAADLTGRAPGEPQAALLRWLEDNLGMGPVRSAERPEVARRRDALHDVIADAPKLADSLRRFADSARQRAQGTGDRLPLNLLALLRTKVNWVANDIDKSLRRRHAARQRPIEAGDDLCANGVAPATARALLGQIARRFADDAVLSDALPLKFAGHTDAAIARQTGHSRPKIQRALQRFREWLAEEGA